jgi:hypothetical protein
MRTGANASKKPSRPSGVYFGASRENERRQSLLRLCSIHFSHPPTMSSLPSFMLFLTNFNNGMSIISVSFRIASDNRPVCSDRWLRPGLLLIPSWPVLSDNRPLHDLSMITLLKLSKSNNVHNQTGCEDQTNYQDPFFFQHFTHSFVSTSIALLSVKDW